MSLFEKEGEEGRREGRGVEEGKEGGLKDRVGRKGSRI